MVNLQAEAPMTSLKKEEGVLWAGLKQHWDGLAFIVILIVALVMRLWALDSRYIHYDEAIHGYFSWRLVEGEGFEHNPLMHGPFSFFAAAFSFLLFGDNDYTLRLPDALFGTALVGLPFFLRRFLGKHGAVMVALLLAFSPVMLYFSRFARQDIIMAFWTLGLVVAVWRYIYEERPIYLYLAAAFLALSFVTKETSYLHLGIIGSFLFILSLPDLVPWLLGRHNLSRFSPQGVVFLLLGTLSLPHWAPLLGYLAQGPMRITLINSSDALGPLGTPLGTRLFALSDVTVNTGMIMAGILVLVLGLIGLSIGTAWNKKQWLVSAAVFYSIWLFFYTTAFTHIGSVGSGIWGSVGYWIVQHNQCRLCQPWYYYFALTSVYEFLPFILALGGLIYYSLRGGLFALFLVYWSATAFLLYSVAGERAPWLLIYMALPLILLGGKFLGEVIAGVPWRAAWFKGSLLAIPLVCFFIVLVVRLIFRYESALTDYRALLGFWMLLLLTIGMGLGALYFSLRVGRVGLGLLVVGLALFLMLFTVRAAWRASYENRGVPVEMLVYAQIYPQAARFTDTVEDASQVVGKEQFKIAVDTTYAFDWPMRWKLRDFKNVAYSCYSRSSGCSPPEGSPDADAVLVHADNESALSLYLDDKFTSGERVPYLGWFPESYRIRSSKQLVEGLTELGAWRRALDYWLYRKLGSRPLSADAYIHFSTSLPGVNGP